MFKIIFFAAFGEQAFHFSRKALDSSPRTMRPSRATTDTAVHFAIRHL